MDAKKGKEKMKTNYEILNGVVERNQAIFEPTTITCEVMMGEYEIVERLGKDVAKKFGIASFIEEMDLENEGEERICTLEVEMYADSDYAKFYSDDGNILYENAKQALRSGKSDVEDTPGLLLNVWPNGKLTSEELQPIYGAILNQVKATIKVAKSLMGPGFKNKGQAFVGIPCSNEFHLKLANDILPNRRIKIGETYDVLMNVSRLKEEGL